ncbi:MAG: hypothetical protein V1820_05625 [archaeon]
MVKRDSKPEKLEKGFAFSAPRFPYGTAEELEAAQDAALRNVLPLYWRTTDLVPEKLRALGVTDPRQISSFAELDSSGFRVTEDDLRERMPGLTRKNIPKFLLKSAHTSGTTGTQKERPFSILNLGSEARAMDVYFDALGIGRKDKMTVLVPEKSSLKGLIPMLCKLYGLADASWLDTYDFGAFMRILPEAEFIFTYTMVGPAFLRHPDARKLIAGGGSKLRGIYMGGSALPAADKEFLEEELGIPVINAINSIEHGIWTTPCTLGHNHLSTIKRAFLDEGTGEIVMSHLKPAEYAALNCETGDVGTFDYSCPCGERVSPRIEIVGRKADEPIKHYPAKFFQDVKAALASDFPDILTGLGTARHETEGGVPRAISATLETTRELSPEERTGIYRRFVEYSTAGSDRYGIPENAPVNAFLQIGGGEVTAFELKLDLRQYSPEERQAVLDKHKPGMEITDISAQ